MPNEPTSAGVLGAPEDDPPARSRHPEAACPRSDHGSPSPPAARGCPGHAHDARVAFVDETWRAVHAWLWWLTGSGDSAADLTQETFAEYWRSVERVDVREPRAWLFRIARNRYRLWRRAVRRTDRLRGRVGQDDVVDVRPGDAAMDAELAAMLGAAVADLPGPYREALMLRVWSDLPHRALARVLGIPVALARWRVHRAIVLLRERVGADPDSQGESR
ncbi:MAG: sigma-70 family RNA polymerase sigma factor [Phycisphaeraceae bacterium]|nr:sigma-70 family RNA polymerase sigma factor [Phycisphaeraceae bacterium]